MELIGAVRLVPQAANSTCGWRGSTKGQNYGSERLAVDWADGIQPPSLELPVRGMLGEAYITLMRVLLGF